MLGSYGIAVTPLLLCPKYNPVASNGGFHINSLRCHRLSCFCLTSRGCSQSTLSGVPRRRLSQVIAPVKCCPCLTFSLGRNTSSLPEETSPCPRWNCRPRTHDIRGVSRPIRTHSLLLQPQGRPRLSFPSIRIPTRAIRSCLFGHDALRATRRLCRSRCARLGATLYSARLEAGSFVWAINRN